MARQFMKQGPSLGKADAGGTEVLAKIHLHYNQDA